MVVLVVGWGSRRGGEDEGSVNGESRLLLQMIGYKTVDGKNCSIWQNVTKIGQKKNVYTFYQAVNGRDPVRYEMIGYDTLLGSHYDKYYIDYTMFKQCQSLPDEDFHVPSSREEFCSAGTI